MVEDLISILTEPKNAIVKQYQQLFSDEDVDLEFTEEALGAIAVKAKSTGTGARALRMIVESILLNLMYETPSDKSISKIIVTKESVTQGADPIVYRR